MIQLEDEWRPDSGSGGLSTEAAEADVAVVDEVLDCKAAAKRRRQRGARCNDQCEEEHDDGGLRGTEVPSKDFEEKVKIHLHGGLHPAI